MKNYLIISLLFLSFGFSQQKKTDKPNPMKGVKTQTISNYDYEEKFGEFEEILIDKLINKYDSNGNTVEKSSYDSDGSLENKFIYKYDSDGNRVIKSSYDSDGEKIGNNTYKYDSNGNTVESSSYDSERSLNWKFIFKYNSKNRIIEKTEYKYESKFGELQQTPTKKSTYEYEEY